MAQPAADRANDTARLAADRANVKLLELLLNIHPSVLVPLVARGLNLTRGKSISNHQWRGRVILSLTGPLHHGSCTVQQWLLHLPEHRCRTHLGWKFCAHGETIKNWTKGGTFSLILSSVSLSMSPNSMAMSSIFCFKSAICASLFASS